MTTQASNEFIIKKGFFYAITSVIMTVLIVMAGTIFTLRTDKQKYEIMLDTHITDKYAHGNVRFVEVNQLQLYLDPIIQRLERIETKIDEQK